MFEGKEQKKDGRGDNIRYLEIEEIPRLAFDCPHFDIENPEEVKNAKMKKVETTQKRYFFRFRRKKHYECVKIVDPGSDIKDPTDLYEKSKFPKIDQNGNEDYYFFFPAIKLGKKVYNVHSDKNGRYINLNEGERLGV